MTPITPIQSTDVRNDALRMLSNGLYVLTACLEDTLHAATVSWISQVSFQPPLLLVALRRNSHLAQAVRQAHRFAVNILGAEQETLAEQFFAHLAIPGESSNLAGYAFRGGPGRCPLLTDAAAWLECRLAAEPPTPGDHHLLLGEVTGAGIRRRETPLLLWNTPWYYGGLRES
jgi:flavin reductase (DIM6/NTAB) family NADH-FMN oxidoreductase RutF